MMNANALETGPGFHGACANFPNIVKILNFFKDSQVTVNKMRPFYNWHLILCHANFPKVKEPYSYSERRRGAHPLYRPEPARHDECQCTGNWTRVSQRMVPSANTRSASHSQSSRLYASWRRGLEQANHASCFGPLSR